MSATALMLVLLASSPPAPKPERVATAELVATAAWARATPPGATTGAGYLTLTNTGDADRLVRVHTAVAARAEVHVMSMKGGVMSMRALDDGLEIPARSTVELAPGGLHLMFFDLAGPLVAGTSITVTLELERAGKREVTLAVMPLGARGPPK